jgi:hypothetical protein
VSEPIEDNIIRVDLTLDKNILRLLKIFSNALGISATEKIRIDNVLSSEITKIIEVLAEDSTGPAQEGFPVSLKKSISRSLNEYKNINQKDNFHRRRTLEDLK